MQHSNTDSCILLKFYIKPQLLVCMGFKTGELYLIEILHQTTTLRSFKRRSDLLYLIEILHQTTTF